MENTEFRLSAIEASSLVWARIKTHLEERLQVLREKNDTTLDPSETARVRGEIAAVKKLLDVGEPPPATITYD